MKLTKEQLLSELKRCEQNNDTEVSHSDADNLLIQYINDDEITKAYNLVDKWYA